MNQRGKKPTRRDWKPRTAQAPSERRKKTDPAREVAFDLLRAVDEADAYANLTLPAMLRRRRIVGRDAAFATELAYGTLRLQGRYDAILQLCLERPLAKLDRPVLDVLRLGAHQLLGMRVREHAAVSETVGLARQRVGAGPAQLVNAVLRQVSEAPRELWLERIRSEAPDGFTALATIGSHPLWIARAFREALAANGRDASELAALIDADNTSPLVTLVARPGLVEPEQLPGTKPGRLVETARVLSQGDPGGLAAVAEARAGVQDEGSQAVTLALAQVPIAGSDQRWLDLCAGPGGKAALLGALAAQRGAHLVANEVSEHRAGLVRAALAAIPEGVAEVRVSDGRELGAEESAQYDRVLVDAPCTGLGALRRRPEARWRRSPSDLAQLRVLQRELLESALSAVREGGVVGYVTCSPHLAETRVVVDDVLRTHPGVERLDAVAALRQVLSPAAAAHWPPDAFGPGPDLQLWPHVHGTDAMHLTLLRRAARSEPSR